MELPYGRNRINQLFNDINSQQPIDEKTINSKDEYLCGEGLAKISCKNLVLHQDNFHSFSLIILITSLLDFIMWKTSENQVLFKKTKFLACLCNDRIFSYQVCMLALKKIYKIQRRNCEILLSSACIDDTGLNTVSLKQLVLDHVCNQC